MAQGHAFHKSNTQHQRSKTTTAIANERQRQPGYWHNIHVHTDVDRALKKNQGGDSVCDNGTRYITSTVRGTQTAPDDEGQDENHHNPADQSKLF